MLVRDMRNGHFFWMHNVVLDDYGAQLGAYGIAVYAVLCRFANNETQLAFPGIATIASRVACSERQVQRMLKKLEAIGLIGIRSVNTKTGAYAHNEYVLQRVGDGDSQTPNGDRESRDGDCEAHDQDSLTKDMLSDETVLWLKVLAELRPQMTRSTFETWLSNSTLTAIDGDNATIECHNAYAAEWCATRLLSAISRTMNAITGRLLTLTFVGDGETFQQTQF